MGVFPSGNIYQVLAELCATDVKDGEGDGKNRTVRTAPKQLCLMIEFLWWEQQLLRAAVDRQIWDQVYERSCCGLAVDSVQAARLVTHRLRFRCIQTSFARQVYLVGLNFE